jgi:hypothetical protein
MERRAELDFTALPAEFPFVAVLPQQILEGTLESALKGRGCRSSGITASPSSIWAAAARRRWWSAMGPRGPRNVGLREAYDLVRRLGFILREDYPPDLLESYDAGRRHEWRQLLGARGKPERGPSTDPWVWKHAARILPCVPASGDDLILLLRQLGLVLPVDHPPAHPRD